MYCLGDANARGGGDNKFTWKLLTQDPTYSDLGRTEDLKEPGTSYEDEGAGAGIVVGGAAGVGSGGAAGVVLEGAVAGAAIIGEAGKEPIYYLGGGEQGTSYFIDDDENSPDAGVYYWRRSSKYLDWKQKRR